MDENNTYINKSEKEALEIMENVSDITSDQLQALRENEECFQTCSDIAEAVIGMQMEKNALSINTQQALADFHRKHLDRRNKKALYFMDKCCRSSGNNHYYTGFTYDVLFSGIGYRKY